MIVSSGRWVYLIPKLSYLYSTPSIVYEILCMLRYSPKHLMLLIMQIKNDHQTVSASLSAINIH